MCHGLHEVCLAESRIAVEKERVVDLARRLSDSLGGRGRELVRFADDEMLERVSLAQGCDAGTVLNRRSLTGRGRHEEVHLRAQLALLVDLEHDRHRWPRAIGP